MDAIAEPSATPESYVLAETYDEYVRQANSFMADRIRDVEREASRWRKYALAGFALAFLGIGTAAVVELRARPEGWLMTVDPSTGRVGILQRLSETQLPPASQNYFLRQLVEMRESYNEATADSFFNAAACMLTDEEQKYFARWYNESPDAPQQIYAKLRNHGYRVATATSDPVVVGVGQGGEKRMQVRFRYEDKSSADLPSKVTTGVATFTVRRDRKRVSACDPDGLQVYDYDRAIDKDAAP